VARPSHTSRHICNYLGTKPCRRATSWEPRLTDSTAAICKGFTTGNPACSIAADRSLMEWSRRTSRSTCFDPAMEGFRPISGCSRGLIVRPLQSRLASRRLKHIRRQGSDGTAVAIAANRIVRAFSGLAKFRRTRPEAEFDRLDERSTTRSTRRMSIVAETRWRAPTSSMPGWATQGWRARGCASKQEFSTCR
jgi:hypothetical protein